MTINANPRDHLPDEEVPDFFLNIHDHFRILLHFIGQSFGHQTSFREHDDRNPVWWEVNEDQAEGIELRLVQQ